MYWSHSVGDAITQSDIRIQPISTDKGSIANHCTDANLDWFRLTTWNCIFLSADESTVKWFWRRIIVARETAKTKSDGSLSHPCEPVKYMIHTSELNYQVLTRNQGKRITSQLTHYQCRPGDEPVIVPLSWRNHGKPGNHISEYY